MVTGLLIILGAIVFTIISALFSGFVWGIILKIVFIILDIQVLFGYDVSDFKTLFLIGMFIALLHSIFGKNSNQQRD